MNTSSLSRFGFFSTLTVLAAAQAVSPPSARATLMAQVPGDERPFSGPKLYSQLQCSVRFEEPSGNDALDAGETANLVLRATNEGQGPARRVRVAINVTVPNPNVSFELPATLGDLGPSQSREVKIPIRGGKDLLDGQLELSVHVLDSYGFKSPTVTLNLDTRAVLTSTSHNAEPHAYALVVGIEKYGQPGIPRAWYAQRDARRMAQAFSAVLGVPSDHVLLLRNEQATKATLRIKLEGRLPPLLKHPDAKLYIYFAGHGVVDPQTRNAALLPYDGDPRFPAVSCNKLVDIYGALQRIGRPTLMFLDTSFGGSSARGDRPEPLPGVEAAIAFNVESRTPPDNVGVFFAASGREFNAALPTQQHGLFTYHLLQGLYRARSVPGLRIYVNQLIQQETRATHGPQTPEFYGEPRFPL